MVKEDLKEHCVFQYSVFYGEYENEKKKGQNNLTFPGGGFEHRIFEQISTHYLKFEGD